MRTIALLLLGSCTVALHAQEAAEEGVEARHELSLLLAHTNIFEGVTEEGNVAWRSLPAWGLNYNYWITPHWAIGLHTDIILETFRVEKEHGEINEENEVLERARPIAPAVMATFRPHHHWAFALGAGEEFAKEGDLFLVRTGVEYTVHLSGAWETSGSATYDFRFDAYDSVTLAFGVTRVF